MCHNCVNYNYIDKIITTLFTTVEQLKRAINTERSKLSQCFTDRAINEWRHRLECVVQQQGGHTQHCLMFLNESVQFCVFDTVCWDIAKHFWANLQYILHYAGLVIIDVFTTLCCIAYIRVAYSYKSH